MADFWQDLRVNLEKFGRWARDWVKMGLVKMNSVRALVKEWMGRIF